VILGLVTWEKSNGRDQGMPKGMAYKKKKKSEKRNKKEKKCSRYGRIRR
jgi:hypothetical protein